MMAVGVIGEEISRLTILYGIVGDLEWAVFGSILFTLAILILQAMAHEEDMEDEVEMGIEVELDASYTIVMD
ncbi:hypothetical protein EDD11_000518 [Mortierella claussenii]|nr:hypothetical protein EDD11_000518 [Mortierella claussenii]